MKLKEIHEPTPKCPRCNVHLISRITIIGNRVYDCPTCQAIYEEEKEVESDDK